MIERERLFLDWLSLMPHPISMSAMKGAQPHVDHDLVPEYVERFIRRGYVERHPACIESAVEGLVDGFTVTTAGREASGARGPIPR